jgi:hypothetical protein
MDGLKGGGRTVRTPLTLCALVLIALPAAAQWTEFPLNNVPLANGKPNLSAPAPKTREGKPDLSGVWGVRAEGNGNTNAGQPKHFVNLAADSKPGEVTMLPWALAFVKEQVSTLGANHPVSRCLPPGVPLSYTAGAPFKIVQNEDLVVMLYEYSNSFRQVFMDNRVLPKDPQPTWVGYSVGRWEDDALVIETLGFNDRTWLDGIGHPHTEALRITERIRRRDFGHLNMQITIDDAKTYEKPWTASLSAELLTNTDVMEYVCLENEKSLQHLVGK